MREHQLKTSPIQFTCPLAMLCLATVVSVSSSNLSLFGQFGEGISLAHRGTAVRASTGSQVGSGKELPGKEGDRVYCGAAC